MIRQLLVAVSFLTRIPVAIHTPFTSQEIGRASRWFPLVGAGIGGISLAGTLLFSAVFPASILSILVVAAGALATGALHMDGLADMADGFGAGRTPDDVLRIMRDHAIGTYGAVALILLIACKAACITVLIERHDAAAILILAPALGRWSSVLLSYFLPYARLQSKDAPAVSDCVGKNELAIATVFALLLGAVLAGMTGLTSCAAVLGVSFIIGSLSHRRIRGVTGDTLGANTELAEVAVFLVAVAWR